MHPLVLILLTLGLTGAAKIDYYRQLWLDNKSTSNCWKRPSGNDEFRKCSKNTSINFGMFDFVIVGGGSAGIILANRLSEIQSWKILLIEAGGNATEFANVPGAQDYQLASNLNYGYLSTPQKNACKGCVNSQCAIHSGKGLGGGSLIDDRAYVRGNKKDFDRWVQEGNSDWSYTSAIKYYKKAERLLVQEIFANKRDVTYHGKNGLLPVSYPKEMNKIISSAIASNEEAGLKRLDYNAVQQIGVSKLQVHVAKGVRRHVADTYLKPIRNRANLVVLTNALATKILFKRTKADSVQFLHDGKFFYATPKVELILAAGAIGTAQLLLLSGVGPKPDLTSLGIKVASDLPVGQNLIDVPFIDFNFKTSYNLSCPNLNSELERYIKGEGLLTLPPFQAVSFHKLDAAITNGYKGVPDIMISYRNPNPFSDLSVLKNVHNWNDRLFSIAGNYSLNDLILRVSFLHPRSRGAITLRSKDPLDYPYVNPEYFSNRLDSLTVTYVIDYLRKLEQTTALRSINAILSKPKENICNHLSGATSQPIGTCKMGSGTDSVVNQQLQLNNFCNIRLVTSGVIPVSISAPSESTLVMIAEKASDIIKTHYNAL